MPELSQRTLGKIIPMLNCLVPSTAETFPEIRNFWRTSLFEHGFPPWLIDFVVSKSSNWSVIVPELYQGRVVVGGGLVGEFICHQMLRNLTVLAHECQDRQLKNDLRLSLQLDGFEIEGRGLQGIGITSIEQEKSYLVSLLKSSKLGGQEVITKHISDAEELFSQGKHHPAIGEARCAMQAVVDETDIVLEAKVGRKSGTGTKNRIDFLGEHGFLTSDEQSAYLSAWGFLSSGNHPGLSSEDEGRIGTIICLEFIQIPLLKGQSLL
jgi:hypothetical protein